jgi:hypothetical protein
MLILSSINHQNRQNLIYEFEFVLTEFLNQSLMLKMEVSEEIQNSNYRKSHPEVHINTET